eukprot:m.88389 g.88389  ORF g.88389 m.88389 type:complete len:644 (-) comp9753_c0_seq2:221-2152(-)
MMAMQPGLRSVSGTAKVPAVGRRVYGDVEADNPTPRGLSVLDLPAEVLWHALSFLKPRDVLAFGTTCQRALVQARADPVWHVLLRSRCNVGPWVSAMDQRGLVRAGCLEGYCGVYRWAFGPRHWRPVALAPADTGRAHAVATLDETVSRCGTLARECVASAYSGQYTDARGYGPRCTEVRMLDGILRLHRPAVWDATNTLGPAGEGNTPIPDSVDGPMAHARPPEPASLAAQRLLVGQRVVHRAGLLCTVCGAWTVPTRATIPAMCRRCGSVAHQPTSTPDAYCIVSVGTAAATTTTAPLDTVAAEAGEAEPDECCHGRPACLLHVWGASRSTDPPQYRRGIPLGLDGAMACIALQYPLVCVGTTTGTIHVYDCRTGTAIAHLDMPALYQCAGHGIRKMLWGAYQQLFVLHGDHNVAEWRGDVDADHVLRFRLWRVHFVTPLAKYAVGDDGLQRIQRVCGVAYAEGRLAACFQSGQCCLYDVDGAKVLDSIPCHRWPTECIDFDGKQIISYDEKGWVRVCDVTDEGKLWERYVIKQPDKIKGMCRWIHYLAVYSVAADDGKTTIDMFDLRQRDCAHSITVHLPSMVPASECLLWFDGHRVVFAGQDADFSLPVPGATHSNGQHTTASTYFTGGTLASLQFSTL